MVEILFSRNLIKVLFATETFAMGVNMPARAVVFNSIRKHDGTQFRVLQPGEYTQMAGRAGRRGLDKVGTVILCCFGDEPPPQLTLRNMLTGSSTRLESQFRLTYNMILNLLRTEELSVENMIKRSFSEFATQRALTMNDYPKLLSRGMKGLAKLEKEYEQDADSRIGAEDIDEYFATSGELLALNRNILSFLLSSAGGTAGGALVPGRILLVTSARKRGYVATPAIIVKAPTTSSTVAVASGGTKSSTSADKESTVCIVLLPESYVPDNESDKKGKAKPATLSYIGSAKQRHYAIHEIGISEIVLVTSSKYKIDSKALFKDKSGPSLGLAMGIGSAHDPFARAKPVGSRRMDNDPFAGMMARGKKSDGTGAQSAGPSSEQSQIDQVMGHLIDAETLEAKSSLGAMDLTECTRGISQGSEMFEFRSASSRVEGLLSTLRLFRSHHHPSIERHYAAIERKEALKATVDTLRHLLSNESLALFPDFLQRKALLRTLGYVDSNDAVQIKGRVACEVNTCEELIVTEMVFEGILNDLEPAEIVAALSALIFQEKSADSELDSELPDSLVLCCENMRKIATNLGEMQRDHGLQIDPKDYCASSLKFGLVHVVYEWALGVPFSNICELTLVQEGSIVRCITRLDELCREVRNCARVVGNPTLYRKAETASVAIKRDIVFASSLYIS
jgi:antiviral helicase SKI2